MKVTSFRNHVKGDEFGGFKASWAVFSPATFRYLHPDFIEVQQKGTKLPVVEFATASGELHEGAKSVTECRLTRISDGAVGIGFTGCSREDNFNLFVGMKGSLARAFADLRKSFNNVNEDDVASFYEQLFANKDFGNAIKFPSNFVIGKGVVVGCSGDNSGVRVEAEFFKKATDTVQALDPSAFFKVVNLTVK